MAPMIRGIVRPFCLDRMLARVEDAESLTNICLAKLHQAQHDFRYDASLSEVDNERIFLGMARKYMMNVLIDHQYSHNLKIRCPENGLVNTPDLGSDEDGEGESEFQVVDPRMPRPIDTAANTEVLSAIRRNLGAEENKVLNCLIEGYTAEQVARKVGMPIGRVRYLIYQRIQPVARDFF